LKRLIRVIGGLLVAALILGAAGCDTITPPSSSSSGTSTGTGIQVTGTGKVSASPDLAVLVAGVQVMENKVAQAQAEAATAMDRVNAALIGNGIDDKDIQTSRFVVSQRTGGTYGDTVIGYQVTNTVRVKIRDLAGAGSIIDTVVAAGGDYIRINNFGFTIEDPTTYYAQALQAASADAKTKAQNLAKQNGVKLGDPINISENQNIYYPYQYDTLLAGAASGASGVPDTSISPGEITITAQVQITYTIK
jgi:uncharacterized protein YggE